MIILYHKVDIEQKSIWYVTVDTFDRQMADLQAYDVVCLDEYNPENPKHVVITFDGIYENVWRYGAAILEKWGYPYELFVIGDHIGGDNAFDQGEPLERFASLEMLEELTHRGARIQWHTAGHRPMDLMSSAEVSRELTVPNELKTRFPDPHFRWFAYPHDIDRSADPGGKITGLVKQNFTGALAVLAGSSTDRYRLNRLTVFEKTVLPSSRTSIIIANYNYGRFLAEAIDSVLRQTHPPDEILLIDDASTDESRSVIDVFSDRITVEINERNLGIVENFKKAVSLTTGDYVGILGADNRMRSDYVERTKAALDAHPDAAVAYTDMTIFGPLAGLLASKAGASPSTIAGLYHWAFPDPTPNVVANIRRRNFVHGSSLFRRTWYDRAGGYRTSSNAEDHDLFSRMLRGGGQAVRVPHRLIEYRQHSQEQANTVLNLQLRITALERTNRELRTALAQGRSSLASAKAVFEFTPSSQGVVVRAGTRLTWTEEGLEIESTHNDPGVIISLPKGHSSWFGLRAIYRSDCDGYAQFYSRTAEEKTFSGKSQILYAIKKGWNFLALPIQRDEYVESVRFDPLDRPGRMLLQEFVLYTL